MDRSKWLLGLSISLGLLVTMVVASAPASGATAGNEVVEVGKPSSVPEVNGLGSSQLPPMAPGVVLVGLKPGAIASPDRLGLQVSGDTSLSATFASIGVRSVEPVFPDIERRYLDASASDAVDLSHVYRLRLALDADVLGAVRELNANPTVAYAEPDYLAHIITTPDDTHYPSQWGLTQIDAPAAWNAITGTSNVVIAIVDAGIDASHADLSGKLWINPGEILGNGIDDDNNGCTDDIHGWNFVDDNADLSDNTGHGTQVAGVASADTNNGAGIAGICWGCRLMVVKVVQSGGVANYSDIAAGVAYAAQKGADVINLSIGGYSDSATLRAAVAAVSQTAVLVGGAGNDDGSTPFYPAAYDEYVLAVAGTTVSDTKVGTSNYGPWVDVSAPGEVITTTFDGGGYGSASGTSMAVPFASGLAGLLLSQHPDWTPDQVRAHIIHTADDVDSLNSGYVGLLGSGRIDAGEAITTAAVPVLSFTGYSVDGVRSGTPAAGDTVSLTVALANDWGTAANAVGTLSSSDPYVSIGADTASFGDIGTYETAENPSPYVFTVSPSAPYAYAMPFSLTVNADGGFLAVFPFTVTTETGIQSISGTLSNDAVWTSDRVYLITADVVVPGGITLTIQPGVEMRFSMGTSLLVGGTLIADGTESAPILFTSAQENPAPGDWEPIKFTQTTVGATVDSHGEYLFGSIVRHAIVEYGEGICASGAYPYFSHITFRYLAGEACRGVPASLQLFNDEICTSTLVIRDSTFLENQENGVAFYENPNCSSGEQLTSIKGNSFLNNGQTAIRIHYSRNPLSATVDISSNKVVGGQGGIYVHTGYSTLFLIENNIFIALTGPPVVESGFGVHINYGEPIVRHNIFADFDDTGVFCAGLPCSVLSIVRDGRPTVISNTFVANRIDTLVGFNCDNGYDGSTPGPYSHNNWADNEVGFVFRRCASSNHNITATYNYWGTSSTSQIDQLIHDYYDDLNPGKVLYQPILTEPEPTAPAYLWKADIAPDPVGIQQATFIFTFSAPMDQSINPTVAFGATAPYTSFTVTDNAQWLSDQVWYATSDVTTLVPRGTYTVSVSGARGADGMETVADMRFSFTVDYAGSITDQTPPNSPWVLASGLEGDASSVEAIWLASDPESSIAGYRYAIGSAPGATDIVNWTSTSDTSMSRSSLGFAAGQQYWVAVQARNTGGLWSVSGYSSFVAGKPVSEVFLPLVLKSR